MRGTFCGDGREEGKGGQTSFNQKERPTVVTQTIDAPITLEHRAFVDYAFNHWLDCLKLGTKPSTLCLIGPPGIGKSSAAHDIAKRMQDYVRANPAIIFGPEGNTLPKAVKLLQNARADKTLTKDDIQALAFLLDFSSKLPEDLGGLPFRNGDFVDYCPQRWVGKLCEQYAFGVYVQDDLPAAPQAMQVAGRQAALERRVHEHLFTDAILIIVTGNRREDKASASTLPAHFRNSVTMLAIEPSLDEWKKWYLKQNGVDAIIAAFLSFKTDVFSETPKDSKDKLGAFATPRSWTALGRQFQTAKRAGVTVLLAIASGCVGKANALLFTGFVEVMNELVDPELVLDDAKKHMPEPLKTLDDPSKRCAMAASLGEHSAMRWKNRKGAARDKVPDDLLTALAWTSVAGDEYSAVGIQTFLDMGGDLTAIARMARRAKNDPVIGRLLDHVKSALLGV